MAIMAMTTMARKQGEAVMSVPVEVTTIVISKKTAPVP